jgi:MFS family permease
MIAADVIRLGAQAVVAALLLTGTAQIWELLVLEAVRGGASAFFGPASTGLVPQIVAPEILQQANALRGLTMSVGGILGPAIAGALVVVGSPGWAIAADAASFGISAPSCGACMRPRSHRFRRRLSPTCCTGGASSARGRGSGRSSRSSGFFTS